jgi:hypothetical protein
LGEQIFEGERPRVSFGRLCEHGSMSADPQEQSPTSGAPEMLEQMRRARVSPSAVDWNRSNPSANGSFVEVQCYTRVAAIG